MGWVSALIGAGGSLLGGALGAKGAKDAGRAQARAAEQQIALQRGIYNSQLQNQEPFRATGLGANNLLAQLYGLPYMDYSPAKGVDQWSTSGGLKTKKTGQNALEKTFGSLAGPLGSAILGGPTWIYRQADNGSIEFNGKDGGKSQLGGSINPQTGEVTLNNDPHGGSAEALTNYLRTGEGEIPKYASRFGQAADALRGSGWSYDPRSADPMSGYHEGTGKGDLSVFQSSPGYQFRLGEGLKSVQNSAAARGGLGSGNSLRAVNDYAQGTASDDFYNFVNQMNNMAGRGQTAVQGQQQAGNAFGYQAGNALGNYGDARASGIAGSANMWGQAISGVADAAGQWWGNKKQPVAGANTGSGGVPKDIGSWYGWRF